MNCCEKTEAIRSTPTLTGLHLTLTYDFVMSPTKPNLRNDAYGHPGPANL